MPIPLSTDQAKPVSMQPLATLEQPGAQLPYFSHWTYITIINWC